MIKTKRWNILDHLKSEKDIKRYLDAAFEKGDLYRKKNKKNFLMLTLSLLCTLDT